MIINILKFLGAIILACLFSWVVDFANLYVFVYEVRFFENFSLSSLFEFDVIRGFLFPIGLAVIAFIAFGLCLLVKGQKYSIILPIIIFIIRILRDFNILFINTSAFESPLIKNVGHGFVWYSCAIVTFVFIFLFYALATIGMLDYANKRNL